MQTILKKYIRDEKNHPRGVAVIVNNNGKISYGFSLNNNLRDKFSKKVGTTIALNRANSDVYNLPSVKSRESMVLDAYEDLEKRALKYFKDIDPSEISLGVNFDIIEWDK